MVKNTQSDAGYSAMAHTQARSEIQEVSRPADHPQGVGGRHGLTPTPLRGGGYLQNCTNLKFSRRDPRLDDLAAMKMPQVFIRIAEQIGVDALMVLWRELDNSPEVSRASNGMILLRLRPFNSWQRHMRDQHIRMLGASGRTPAQIQQALMEHYKIKLTTGRISRILNKSHD